MKKPPIIWLNLSVFVITFIIAIIGVPYWALHHGFSNTIIIATIISFIYCGMSITAGYHRLWSHKTYQAHWSLRLLFALGGAYALQNSILHWSSDHRVHHKHVDNNDIDPYSAKKGFWYSHIGWMCREYQAHRYNDYANVRDLQKDGIVMWQHKYYLPLALIMNIAIPFAVGIFSGDIIGGIIMVGFMRLVLNHHTTFFINSLAHIWGKQTYTDKNSARDNGILALLTFGEGYHNFHHIFENDYRNGIRWWHFDPTKWLIKLASYVRLTTKLRKVPEDKIEKAKLAMMFKLSQQKLTLHPEKEQMLAKLQQEYDLLIVKMNDYYTSRKQLINAKREQLLADVESSDLVKQYKELKNTFIEQKRYWKSFTTQLV
jgi:stearoyl-CoA desaturase (delta-9 desaturase)